MTATWSSLSRKNRMKALKKLQKSLILVLSISILIPFLNAPTAQAAAPNPTNYYQLEGNGADSIGGQNASVYGSISFPVGKYGNGYSATGPNSGFLNMGPNVGLFGAGNFTMGFWFNSAGGSGQILNKRQDDLHFITISMHSLGYIQTELRSKSASNRADIFRAPRTSGDGYNNGAWHHFALVRSGSTVSLYVDGQFSSADSGLGDLNFNNSIYNSANFIFGASTRYPGLGFVGGLDDLKIYNVALTQSDVQASMLSNTPPPPPPVLIDQAPLNVGFIGDATSPTRQLVANGGSGSGAISFAVIGGTGNCTIVASLLTFGNQGNCLITATKAADAIYKSATSPANDVPYFVPIIPVVLPAPLITNVQALSSSSIRVFFNSVPNATGYQVNVYSNVDGSPLLGNTARVTTSATGALSLDVTGLVQNVQDPSTYSITEYQFRVVAIGDGVAFLRSNESGTWTGHTLVEPLQPLAIFSGSIPFNAQWILNASGGSPFGMVTFTLGNGGTASGCAISGNILSATSPGTCLVAAQKSADRNYVATTTVNFATLTFTKINQATLNMTGGSATYGETINLASTGGSGSGTVSYALVGGAINTAGCAIAGTILSATSIGTCSVIATNPGDNFYSAISSRPATFTFTPKAATVTVNDDSKIYGEADPSLTYTATGLLPGDTLTGSLTRAAGENVGTYAIGGTLTNSNYLVTLIPGIFTINKASQNALIITSKTAKVGTSLPLTFTGGSGTGAITYSVVSDNPPRACKIVNGVLSFTGVGSCTVTLFKAGDGNYLPASSTATKISFMAKP